MSRKYHPSSQIIYSHHSGQPHADYCVPGIDDWYEEKYYDIFALLIQHETKKTFIISRELHRFTYSYTKLGRF
jgi:tRNA splicing endonuclease